MMLRNIVLFSSLFLIISCGDEQPQKETIETPIKVLEEEPIKVEPQTTFDQSQMNSKMLGWCVQFKTLKGADRNEVFKKIEPILPSCPMKILEDNTVESDPLNAVQIMTIMDLEEILGAPDEIREDGIIVYRLTETYRVVFIPEKDGSVCCRAYEGDS